MEGSSFYTFQDVPGKGKGLIASVNIPRGTRILEERPIITEPEQPQSDEWLKRHLSQQVNDLDEHQRQSLLSLYNLYPYNDEAEQVFGIFRTNGLPIDANGTVGGVFLEACRINHSCDNNAQKHWNNRIERHTVHAVRTIPKGEEITIYYLGRDSSRDVRRQKLQDKFGFVCSCRLCSLSTADSQKSDQRLKRIDQLDDLVGRECGSMNFSQQTLRYVDERVQLYDSWGPGNSGLPRAYFDAAQIATANGDLARGRIFAERAVAGWRTAHGGDSDEVIQYTPLARNPAKFPLCGISKNWSTPLGEVPPQFDSNDFEDWLWRREQPEQVERSKQPKRVKRSEQPKRVEQSEKPKRVDRPEQPKIFEQLGQFTNLRNREIFPDFTSLPLRSGLVEATPASPHWCFLGEIVGFMTLHHLELNLTDVDNNSLPLHFNTAGLGTEITTKQIREGYTVAVLYARRQSFMYGDPGIKLVDPRMLKVRISQTHNLLLDVLT
jgi:hypothetical protein